MKTVRKTPLAARGQHPPGRPAPHRSRSSVGSFWGLPGITAVFLSLLACIAPPPGPLSAQEVVNGERPTVFIDCAARNCNQTYFRTELPWINWARQPQDADVHLILTSQTTGAGGSEYRLDFIGTGDFEYEHQLRFQASPTNTQRETLDGITQTIGIGVLHFATIHGFFDDVNTFQETLGRMESEGEEVDPTERVVTGEEVEDPWDFWVFRLSGNTEVNGEQTRQTTQIRGNASASRVTHRWKMNFRGDFNVNRREIDLPDNGTFTDERTDWGVSELIAYALADHWSIGVRGEVRKITRFNQNFRWEVTPALEYSFFPYEEATRRALTLQYTIGPAFREYIEETVYGWLSETRWEEALEIEFSQRQPWGNASVRINGSHFIYNTDLYAISLRGDLSFRVFRGLNLNAEGGIGWVHDQIYLSAQGATDAEALLNLRQRAQDFNYEFQVGFSFQFGSVYNNVVNNRFRENWWR